MHPQFVSNVENKDSLETTKFLSCCLMVCCIWTVCVMNKLFDGHLHLWVDTGFSVGTGFISIGWSKPLQSSWQFLGWSSAITLPSLTTFTRRTALLASLLFPSLDSRWVLKTLEQFVEELCCYHGLRHCSWMSNSRHILRAWDWWLLLVGLLPAA